MKLGPYILAGALLTSAVACEETVKADSSDSGTKEQMCLVLGEDLKNLSAEKGEGKANCKITIEKHQRLMRIAGLLETGCRVNTETINLAIEGSRSKLDSCIKRR